MPKVSIIIPIYNVEKYLEKCLNSVVNQTLKDIEIICINDGSTDSSPEILKQFSEKDSRIVVINQENQGIGAARDNGLKIAKGDYVGFIDSDDWVEEEMYEELYNAAIENNVEVVQCNIIMEDEQSGENKIFDVIKNIRRRGINIKPNNTYNLKDIKKCVMRVLPNYVWMRIYKRDFLERNNLNFSGYRVAEDQAFSISVKILSPIYYLEEPLYHYLVRQNSLSKRIDYDYMTILKHVEKVLIEQGKKEDLKTEYDKYVASFFVSFYRARNEEEQKEYFKFAQETLTKDQFKIFKRRVTNNFFENIFSIKSKTVSNQKSRVLTILGKSIKLYEMKNF